MKLYFTGKPTRKYYDDPMGSVRCPKCKKNVDPKLYKGGTTCLDCNTEMKPVKYYYIVSSGKPEMVK